MPDHAIEYHMIWLSIAPQNNIWSDAAAQNRHFLTLQCYSKLWLTWRWSTKPTHLLPLSCTRLRLIRLCRKTDFFTFPDISWDCAGLDQDARSISTFYCAETWHTTVLGPKSNIPRRCTWPDERAQDRYVIHLDAEAQYEDVPDLRLETGKMFGLFNAAYL